MRQFCLFIFCFLLSQETIAQPLVVSGVSVSGRFNSCSGSNMPTITANLISSGSGSNVSGGIFNCIEPCATSTIRVVMSNVKWNKQPNNEWLHGLFLPANLGFSVVPVTIPNGFIAYNTGCIGLCPSGSGLNSGPGFYYDNTADNSCCGTILANDGIPCNNFGNVNIGCGASLSLTFDIIFCNSLITSNAYQFIFTGTSDGETGCYFQNDGNAHQIKFSITTNPCITPAINPMATVPMRSCASGSLNYTSNLSGNCSGNNIYWWNAATGGTLLGSGSPFTFDPAGAACPAGTTLYATCCSGASTNCVARTPVTIPGVCNVISISGASFIDATCVSLGSIDTLFVLNAQGTLSYTLNPGGIVSSSCVFNSLTAGTYTVKAKDTTDCEAIMIITIGAPPLLSWSNFTSSNVTCNGFANGSISCLAIGGTGIINYTLQPGASTNITGLFNTLSSGIYTVTASDANGCSLTTTFNLINPSPLVWNVVNPLSPTCFGLNDGSLQVQATGGTGSLQYQLNPGAFNSLSGNYIGLAAGTYSVLVTDANGCTSTTNASITQPNSLLINLPLITNPLCNGSASGNISITATGGTGSINYTLMPGAINNLSGNFNNLMSGIYTLSASDANGCSTNTTIQLTNPPSLNWNAAVLNQVNCFNSNNGQISITAFGGIGLLTYSLTPSGISNTSGNFLNLFANNYTITVSDANACSISTVLSITQPTQIAWTTINANPIQCFGQSNGSLSAVASGGSGSLNYTLQPGSLSNSTGTFAGLAAGLYTIQVSDANNCNTQTTINITQPNALTWTSINTTAVSCFAGNNGIINSLANGGSGILNYNLQPGGVSNTSGIFSGLMMANYTIQVVDANGCSLSTIVQLNQAPLLNITNIVTTIPSCVPGNDASITISASGGTGSLQYNIGGANQSSNLFNNVGAGMYTLVVTDANGCTKTSLVNIQTPFSPSISSIITTDIGCFGESNGSATITASGGTGTLTYTLMPGSISNASGNFTSLSAGNYSIVVSDANGCAVNSTLNITQPNQLNWTISSANPVSCFGANNGSINVMASGGTGAMNYTLQPGGINNLSGSFTSLVAGIYTIQVSDANNCSALTTLTITQNNALQFTAAISIPVSCFSGSNGSLQVSTTGGTGLVNYTIQPSGISNSTGNFIGLSSGTYTILAADANACTQSTTLQVTQTSLLSITNLLTSAPTCVPGNDASITVNANGGSVPYQYSLGGANQLSNVFINLGAGTYTILVTDANGCTAISLVQIVTSNAPFISNITTQNASCIPGNDGIINVVAGGGLSPYAYSSTGIIFQAANQLSGLTAGNYSVVVKDANGCTVSSMVNLGSLTSPSIASINTIEASCIPGCDGMATINATGGSGVYQYSVNGSSFQSTATFSLLCTNSYSVVVVDGNGCTATATFSITTANGPGLASSVVNNVSCKNGNNGSIAVTANAGSPGYTYTIQPGGITNNSGIFNTLSANTYTIIIADSNACNLSTSFTITEPDSLLWNGMIVNSISCFGFNNGSMIAPVIGGTGPYNYNINPSASFTAPNTYYSLSAGNYIISVSDANNCSISQSISITEPLPLNINTTTITNITCFGLNNGSIIMSASGGSGLINYSLQPGGLTNTSGVFNSLSIGVYSIQVSDANNCMLNTVAQVVEPAAIIIDSFNLIAVSCYNAFDGEIFISGIGGIGNLLYSLQPVGVLNSSGLFTGLNANTYTLSIIDSNACQFDTSLVLQNPAAISFASINANNVLCNGDSNGSIQVSAIGGTGLLSYTLLPGLQNNTTGFFSGLSATIYTVIASDINNCSLATNISITQPLPIALNLLSLQNVTCFNGNDGIIQVSASGGLLPYQFTLLPSGTINATGTFNNLSTGLYSIVVSDSNACSTALSPIIITQGPPITWNNISIQPIACFGDNNGSISVTAFGGIGGLNYSISPSIGAQLSAGIFSSLPAGNYTITCTDINLCSVSTVVNMSQSTPILIGSIQLLGPSCFGDANGSIIVTAIGGHAPYTYQLNGGPSQVNGLFANLNAGVYTLSIMDSSSCQLDTILELISPSFLSISDLNILPENCENSNDASIVVNASGGGGLYTFTLNPGSITNQVGNFINLKSGNYFLNIKDSSGCSADTAFIIYPIKDPLRLITTKQDLTCVGTGNEGWAEAIVTGGNAPISYQWNTNPIQYTSKASGLYFGFYLVEVTDANGCSLKDTIYIAPGPCCEELFVPNAFSPNNDGLNDVFRISTTAGIALTQFAIYDRWGKKVWQTFDYRDSWNGTYDGSTTTTQTFYYIFSYKCLTDGKQYLKTGDLMLIK